MRDELENIWQLVECRNELSGKVKDYTLNSGLKYWLGGSVITENGNDGGEVGQRKGHLFNLKCLKFDVFIRSPHKDAHGK